MTWAPGAKIVVVVVVDCAGCVAVGTEVAIGISTRHVLIGGCDVVAVVTRCDMTTTCRLPQRPASSGAGCKRDDSNKDRAGDDVAQSSV